MRTQLSAADGDSLPLPLVSYTVRQVSTATHLHPESVREACREGRIRAVRMGWRWRISHRELVRLLRKGFLSRECGTHERKGLGRLTALTVDGRPTRDYLAKAKTKNQQ